MNYRLLLLVFLFLGGSNFLFGQLRAKKKNNRENAQAIVQYNDGSVFIGRIVEEGPLTLKLVVSTNDTLNLNKAYIKRLKRSDKNISLYSGAKYHYTKGVFYSLNFGGKISDGDDETIQIDLTVGYRFNKKLSAGVGFGASFNSVNFASTWIEAESLPVFAYARFYPLEKKVRPFVAGRLGWSFPNTEAFGGFHEGGILIQPEVGINFASRKKIRFLITLSQQLQNIKGSNGFPDNFGNPVTTDYNFWFNRTILKFGIEWK